MDAPTVLLIDGDRDSRIIYTMILEHYGLRVLQAADGDEGLRLAREHSPDLVVLEPFVPTRGGRWATELLAEDVGTRDLRVMLVTAVPQLLEKIGQEGRIGASLTKPCQPRRFLAEVQRQLEPTMRGAA